jgi:hypothetical protein
LNSDIPNARFDLNHSTGRGANIKLRSKRFATNWRFDIKAILRTLVICVTQLRKGFHVQHTEQVLHIDTGVSI